MDLQLDYWCLPSKPSSDLQASLYGASAQAKNPGKDSKASLKSSFRSVLVNRLPSVPLGGYCQGPMLDPGPQLGPPTGQGNTLTMLVVTKEKKQKSEYTHIHPL